MNPGISSLPWDANEEVIALIKVLHDSGQRLEELTAGEVDTVADREGRTFLLRHAQEHLRQLEAARQAAILNALPAHIALLDARGRIISANETWRRFADANVLHGPGHAIGVNYLEVCDDARGKDWSEAREVGAGIRAVLGGETNSFSIEYPCHSATEQRWFMMTVTPLAEDRRNGVVVMHLNVTERKQAQQIVLRERNLTTAVFNSLPGLFYVIDDQARFLRWNTNFEKVSGYSSAELLDLSPADLFAGQDKEIIAEKIKQVFVVGEVTVEADLIAKDKTKTPYYFTGKLFQGDQRPCLIGMGIDITERKRAEARITYLNRVYAVLSGINTLIVRVPGRDELFRETCRIAVEAGGFRMVWIGIVDRNKMKIVPIASAGMDEGLLNAIKDRYSSSEEGAPLGNSKAAQAIREKRPLVSNDSINDSAIVLGNRYAESGVRSLAVLPLIVADEAVGVLVFCACEIEFFHLEEMRLLTELAGDIAFAIDHIGTEEKIARLSRVKAVTSGINSLIVRARDRQELYDGVCRIAVELGKFGTAWIGALDYVTNEISSVAWAGDAADDLARTRATWRPDVATGTGVVSRAVREKRPIFDNDIAASATGRSSRRAEAVRAGFRSLIAVPFVIGENVVGHVSLYAKEANFFTEDEVTLLVELAGNIAFAIEHIDKQEKFDKLSRIRAVSGQTNAAIVRISERDALLKEVCRIAVEVGKFDLVWIGALDQKAEKARAIAWAGFPSEVAQSPDWKALTGAQTTLAESMQTGKIAVRNDLEAQAAAGVLREEAVKQGCRSAICLPLVVDGNMEGVILLYAPGANFFDHDEVVLLNEVSSDLSFALQSMGRREQLNYLAYYDALTGLANRTLFLERLAQYMRTAVSNGHKLAIGLLDLERFKNINDSLGRPAGDALLKQVAEWLTRKVGDAGLLARVGADHFALLLPEVKPEGNLARLAEKTLDAFVEHPFHLNDAVFRITGKMGVTLFPDDGSDAGTLMKNAEAALKKAKASGERYLFFTQKMNEAMAGKLNLENQLRQALENEEFVLHYQPKVSLANGTLTSAEALIRWNDPRTGLVPPGRFIPILEETGLIYEVGRWALRKAIADYLRWRAAGLPAVRIAVNVSPLQLRNRGFIAEIKQVVDIDAQAADGLELEITESVIMDDVKKNIESLHAIRAMGVTIAIDDFGTGFSSLSYLAKLPVDTLKIDRSFVIDMTASPEGLALVSTIVNLAHALKRKVVAEGVETEEQSRLLRLLNCDEMQGYLFSKPVPGEVFETKFLARSE